MSAYPWIDKAITYLGVKEDHNNPVVLRFFKEAGHPEIKSTSVAWCAAFVGAMLFETGYKNTGSLAARSYENYGTKLSGPRAGCIVVFPRGNPGSGLGHVGFVEKVDGNELTVISGNESDEVKRAIFQVAHAIAFRWPVAISETQPAVRPKPIVKSKIATGAATIGVGEAIDLGTQTLNKVGDAKDAADRAGVTDQLLNLAHNPRVLFGVVVVLICAGIIYWRWKDHGNGATQ